MKLSDRVRPGSEAAPWVIEEIKRLEAELEAKQAAPDGFRVMRPTSTILSEGDRWEIYAPCGSGGIVNEDDVTDWVVRKLLDALAAAPATVQGDEAGETRRVCHACATWSRNKACPVCDPQMSHMTLQLLEALEGLVNVNEQHNAAIQRVTGTPAGWKDDYLNQARAAIAAARQEGGKV